MGCEMTGGQRTLQTPHTMQWAVRQQDSATGSTSAVNSTSTRPATSTVAATTTGIVQRFNNNNNNTQDDIYSAVIMTTRSLREFTRFITLHAKLSGTVYCYRFCLQWVSTRRLWLCGSVTTITRNCVHRSLPNWVCR